MEGASDTCRPPALAATAAGVRGTGESINGYSTALGANHSASAARCRRGPHRPREAKGAGLSEASPSSPIGVDAERAGSERNDLQQTAGHRDVLEEVDELVQVREIAVEPDRGRERE